jgi:site-specific DNA-methyltransferase (adenine-specific)
MIAGVIGVRVVQQSLLDWKPDMKFDVVVGNPPYQDGRDKLFYQKFVNRAYEMSADVVAMITPAGWTSIADLKTSFCKNIINSGILVYKRLKETAFRNVQVSTVYFISSKSTKSDSVLLSALNDSISIPRRDIPYFPVETVAGISIIEKIRLHSNHGLHSKSGNVWRNEVKIVDSVSGIKCIFSAGKKNEDFDWAYVDPETVLGNYGKHKVIVSHVTQYGILGNLKYASPEYGVAAACHSIPVENEDEGRNLISYLETKFVKFIVRTLKGSVKSNSHSLFAAIPHLGFSRPWADSELYAHFGLTQEEIDYIEATVK